MTPMPKTHKGETVGFSNSGMEPTIYFLAVRYSKSKGNITIPQANTKL
jgi:hypothetical protein